MAFDYFYGRESEQYAFYRIPKLLFTNEKLKSLSTDAKLLHGILMDRVSLSVKNGWVDKKGRVYIIFTLEEIMEAMGCADQEESRSEEKLEKVQMIPLSELHPFKNHPFKVLDDEAMLRTIESVSQYGVLVPGIVRPRPEGGCEIVAGHRRHHALELIGKETMPVIVREMDDDTAVIQMVDSNFQRENVLPSERAFAYNKIEFPSIFL